MTVHQIQPIFFIKIGPPRNKLFLRDLPENEIGDAWAGIKQVGFIGDEGDTAKRVALRPLSVLVGENRT